MPSADRPRREFHQPVAQGVVGMQLFWRQETSAMRAASRPVEEALGASPAGDQAEGGATMSEKRHGLRQCAAGRRAPSRVRHPCSIHAPQPRRSREVRDGVHQPLSHLRETESLGTVQFGDFVQVCTGGKEVGVSGDYQSRRRLSRRSSTADVSATTRARVKRLVPSSETSRKIAALSCVSTAYKISSDWTDCFGKGAELQSMSRRLCVSAAKTQPAVTPRGFTLLRMNSMIASI